MKHYITNELISNINNLYFNYIKDNNINQNKLFPLSQTISFNSVIDDIIKYFNEIKISSTDELYLNLIDILTINTDSSNDLLSKLGKSLKQDVIKLETNINNMFKTNYFAGTNEIIDILNNLDKKLNTHSYLVGGAVRDICLNKIPNDFDFCTDIDLDILQTEFKKENFEINAVGKQFLVLIVTKNGNSFEIANLRKDKDNSAGIIGDIYDDSARRDFTINAGYIELNGFKLVDPNASFIKDIKTKTLRFIGNADNRIKEDPLRVIRFYKFVSRGFNMDTKSLKAVRKNFEYSLKHTAAERIKNEIEGIVFNV